MTHGDEVRGWGGFPYSGLDKAHGRLVVDLETVFTYWLLSHWHQAASLPAGRGARASTRDCCRVSSTPYVESTHRASALRPVGSCPRISPFSKGVGPHLSRVRASARIWTLTRRRGR